MFKVCELNNKVLELNVVVPFVPIGITLTLFQFAAVTTAVDVTAGNVMTVDPSAPVVGCNVMLPLVAFANPREPTAVPSKPRTGARV